MFGYTGGRREIGLLIHIPHGNFYVVFFDGSSPWDLLPSPGSSDVLIKYDMHTCKTEEETGVCFKRLTDPNVTLVKLGMRAEVLRRAFLRWGLRSRCCGWRSVPHAALGKQWMLSMSPMLLSSAVFQRACCPLKCSLLHFTYLMKYGFD